MALTKMGRSATAVAQEGKGRYVMSIPLNASVIVLAWNGIEYLDACLNAVLAQDYANFEVIVVDNGSTDGSADLVAEHFSQIQLIRNERNLGFAAGNNVGLRAATGDVLVLLNQDTEVRPGWLAALVDAFRDETVGVAGCKTLYPNGTIQHGGGFIRDARGYAEHYGWHEVDEGQCDRPRDVEFVTGAALAISRLTMARIGVLDEGFYPAYYEDTDWCFRARETGYKVRYVPGAVSLHHESASISRAVYDHTLVFHRNRLRFLLKHCSPKEMTEDFASAEKAWITSLSPCDELTALRRAYMENLLALPELLGWRQRYLGVSKEGSQHEIHKLTALLLALRATCLIPHFPLPTEQLALDAEPDAGEERHARQQTQAGGRKQLLHDLCQCRMLQPQPFRSDKPLIGPAIAFFREQWNNVAARWYIQPLLQQQVEFNTTVLSFLTMLDSYLSVNSREVVENTREINTLLEQVLEMRQELGAWRPKLETHLSERDD